MDTTQYFVACAVILNDHGKILLTKRHNPNNPEVHDKWQLPGGSVDFGEHPSQSAIREVKEETNLSIKHLSDKPFIFSHTFKNSVHVVLIVYKTILVSGELDISGDPDETNDAKWLELDEIKHLNSLPETYEIVSTILRAKE